MKEIHDNTFLVCIDSDGCAIDSMTIKHEKAFGPAFIEIWNIPIMNQAMILEQWNKMNLYSLTRGINRFQGLLAILNLHPELVDPQQLNIFTNWVITTKALSAKSLMGEYQQTGLMLMGKALEWSKLVNSKIEQLPLSQPFEGVKETIRFIKPLVHIAVVSSANLSAIKEEWVSCGLYDLVDHFYSQTDGTKTECIEKLISMGYQREKTIMVGDALGDYQAAKSNGVKFFPILAGNEALSWEKFQHEYLKLFLHGQFNQTIQEELCLQMNQNLA